MAIHEQTSHYLIQKCNLTSNNNKQPQKQTLGKSGHLTSKVILFKMSSFKFYIKKGYKAQRGCCL